MTDKHTPDSRERRDAAFLSDDEIVEGVTSALRREYPLLWNLACEYDFAERLGGCTDPLRAEADAALRELWMARTNLKEIEANG